MTRLNFNNVNYYYRLFFSTIDAFHDEYQLAVAKVTIHYSISNLTETLYLFFNFRFAYYIT